MKSKKIFYIMLCICVAFIISGCGNNTHGSTATPTNIPQVAVITSATATPTYSAKEPTISPPENVEVTIYTLNSDSLKKEAVTILLTANEELTPEFIIEQVVDAMEGEGFYIGINQIVTEGESVRIDFKSDAAPVVDVGASVEGSIIDILAQSILDNLPQYKKIYISIEGGPYHSGHIEFELDEVYLGR